MAKKKNNDTNAIPPGALAFLTFFGSTLVLFAISEGLGKDGLDLLKGRTNEVLGLIAYNLIIAICCFYIVKNHPASIWYVPLLANILGLSSAFVEAGFWQDPLIWALYSGGWLLSVIVSIIGARLGKKPSFQST